ncbi:development-specific protein LVN1.2-like [Antedon mediterranea]|uniref:development-specific protein LVN1.2-like n=1 Tax=Antedon mediterranea TaxID=105859 RepID=UPI003AF66FDF
MKSRIALNVTTVVKEKTTTTIIVQKFTEKTQWVIDPLAKHCTKMAIPAQDKINRCVPDNATFDGQATFAGDKLVYLWAFPLHTATLNGMYTSTVTADDCIPVTSFFYGNQIQSSTRVPETDILESSGYYNFKGLDDVSKYFVLPSYCQNQNLSVRKTADNVKKLLERHSVLPW